MIKKKFQTIFQISKSTKRQEGEMIDLEAQKDTTKKKVV
jgi:hypothetical protein